MGYVRTLAIIMIAAAFTVGAVETVLLQHSIAAGATEAAGFGVGDTLSPDQVHIITKPGLYGLGPEPAGSKYAVAGGKLIRIDPKSGKVLSILRSQSEILD